MYKDKETAKAASKERVRRYRNKQKGVTSEGVTKEGVTSEGVTKEGVTSEGVTYPPILYALCDKEKREKLTRICEALKHRNLLPRVYYGFNENAVDFETVNDMIEATGG